MQPSSPATTSQEALGQLQTAQSQAQDPNSILQAQNNQFGVNNAQQTVTGLRGAINNTTKLLQQVAPSVMGRTGSSLVTNAQATRQIQNEQAPISQNLATQTNDYNQANQDLGTAEQRAQQAASGIYAGQQDKLSYLQNLYNSLYGKEKDAADRAFQQQQLAEQQREANMKTSGSDNSGLSAVLGALLGGSQPAAAANAPAHQAPTLTGGKSLTDAATALKQLLGTKNPTTIRNTISAIQKSAQYGNTYDQAKLQLINTQPEFAQYLANFNGATF